MQVSYHLPNYVVAGSDDPPPRSRASASWRADRCTLVLSCAHLYVASIPCITGIGGFRRISWGLAWTTTKPRQRRRPRRFDSSFLSSQGRFYVSFCFVLAAAPKAVVSEAEKLKAQPLLRGQDKALSRAHSLATPEVLPGPRVVSRAVSSGCAAPFSGTLTTSPCNVSNCNWGVSHVLEPIFSLVATLSPFRAFVFLATRPPCALSHGQA